MDPFRIALANVRFPADPLESITLATNAVVEASQNGARIICFPECFVPGYRGIGKSVPPPDPEFLERAWSVIALAAAKANITVVLGTERFVDGALIATALVIGPDGSDLIHEIIVALQYSATVFEFVRIPHLHPTLAEIWTYPAETIAERISATRSMATAV